MNWPLRKLGAVTEKIGSGSTPKGGDSVYVTDGTALIRSQNVYNTNFEKEGLAYITDETAEKMKGVTVCDGDVLLNITGDSVARCCMVPSEHLPARVNQHVAIIRTNNKKIIPAFLMYYLVSPYMQAYMLSLSGAGGTRKALTKGMIEGFDIPVPEINIQENIVNILEKYELQIKNNRRRIQLLEESARLLYREWFVHLRFPGHEHVKVVDGVPQGWTREPLGNLLTLQRGFDLPVNERYDGEVPIYASTGINGYHNVAKVSGPGVVTGRSGSLGTVIYVPNDYWPLNTTLWVKEFKKVTPLFSAFLLRSMKLEQYNAGAAVPTLNRNDVHSVEVLAPTRKIIDEFEGYATELFKQIQILQNQIKKLSDARDLLLPRLMNGDIAV